VLAPESINGPINGPIDEPIIEPDIPIIDPHHHLWLLPEQVIAARAAGDSLLAQALDPMYRRHARYLFDEFLADVRTGHDVRASVFVDGHAMYRATGPGELKSVGEVEFVNGVAAMAASGLFGEFRACAGIVGGVDLSLGDAVEEVLTAHLQAGGDRYRGVRSPAYYDEDQAILGAGARPRRLLDPTFRKGFGRLRPLGLSFDVAIMEPQLPDVIDLARAFTETPIILDHLGGPLGIGRFAGRLTERFPIWRHNMRTLARCENVVVKLGGLGTPFAGFASYLADPPFTSERLAAEWQPYVETCVEAFGADRCMFESNFPVDSTVCSYPVLWNTFKRIVAGASPEEKTALFSGTARRVYRIDQ
jgi:L-fuconolactonase